MEKRERNIVLISAAMLIVVIIAGYFMFFYSARCSDKECFVSHMQECSRASYLNEDENAIWQYNIRRSLGDCKIDVKVIDVKTDIETSIALKGKEMRCTVPRDILEFEGYLPEKKLEYCHGELKEAMQDLMIKRMQAYIINSLDQISK